MTCASVNLLLKLGLVSSSNSYWIDDTHPCVTYGLRGVVHAIIDVVGKGPDVHSGVDGGATTEPMMDM